MKIFFIPSWYPGAADPVAGVFHRDQALAIGDLRPDWCVAISLWGQDEFVLRVRAPQRWPGILREARRRRAFGSRRLRQNVVEYDRPAVVWSPRLLGGRRKALVAANRENLHRALRDLGRVDVIHAHVSYPAGWVAMHLGEQHGIPYALTEHMGPFPFASFLTRDGALKPIVREPMQRASALMAVAPALARRMVEFGLPEPEVVPLLADETFFVPPERERDDRAVFFTLGSVTPEKGIPDLLDAVALFLEGGTADEVVFRIGGDGTCRPAYEAETRRRGLSGHVAWLGRLTREQVRDEMRSCSAFVLPSRHEAGSTATVEAIACGRPVIATRCGAPEFILTPEMGLLVDVGRPEQLAEAFRAFLADPGRFDPHLIRARFLERFSRPVVVDALERVYRRAIGSTSAISVGRGRAP